jgi:hypothetical protein
MPDSSRWTVRLPPGVHEPFDVYLNGVRQQPGDDYEHRGATLVFDRPLAKEGKLGFWRWFAMFMALFGTYRKNDSVDVEYSLGGRRQLAVGLDIEQPAEGEPVSGS